MDNEAIVFMWMEQARKPMSAGEIEKVSDLDRKAIDKAFKVLKEKGMIVSPGRCKWEPVQS